MNNNKIHKVNSEVRESDLGQKYLPDGSIDPEYLEMSKRKTLIESIGASLL